MGRDLKDRVGGGVEDRPTRAEVLGAEPLDDLRPGGRDVPERLASADLRERGDHLAGKTVGIRGKGFIGPDTDHLPVSGNRVFAARALREPGERGARTIVARDTADLGEVSQPEALEIGKTKAPQMRCDVSNRIGADRITVFVGIRQRSDSPGIKDKNNAPRHVASRFELRGAMPPRSRSTSSMGARLRIRLRLAMLCAVSLSLPWCLPSNVDAAAVPAKAALDLDARHVTFFSERYLLVGDGDVRLRCADGTTVTGDYFAMNLRLNRYIVAGNIHVATPQGSYDGAGYSAYLDQRRVYFLPVTDQPDRWTFLDGDFSHPLLGREMPGDAFDLPPNDLGVAYILSKEARIEPHQSIRFTPAQLNVQGVFTPLPDYVFVFSSNPNFAQNSLVGAELDAPYPFAGSNDSLSTFHIRYDQNNKLYAAFEQHFVGRHSYLVTSINPLTRPQKQYNLLAFDALSPVLQFRTFAQENTRSKAASRNRSTPRRSAMRKSRSRSTTVSFSSPPINFIRRCWGSPNNFKR